MKHTIAYSLAIAISLLSASRLQSFTTYNAPLEYENRYNANSFIFNCNRYLQRYAPSKDPLGDEAIEKLAAKKNKSKKGPRLFTRYRHASEK